MGSKPFILIGNDEHTGYTYFPLLGLTCSLFTDGDVDFMPSFVLCIQVSSWGEKRPFYIRVILLVLDTFGSIFSTSILCRTYLCVVQHHRPFLMTRCRRYKKNSTWGAFILCWSNQIYCREACRDPESGEAWSQFCLCVSGYFCPLAHFASYCVGRVLSKGHRKDDQLQSHAFSLVLNGFWVFTPPPQSSSGSCKHAWSRFIIPFLTPNAAVPDDISFHSLSLSLALSRSGLVFL